MAASTALHAGPLAGGLRGPVRGARTWACKGATRQERVDPHGQFTGVEDFTARAASTATHVDAFNAVSMPNQLVMAWQY
jgi:hypothetical protein